MPLPRRGTTISVNRISIAPSAVFKTVASATPLTFMTAGEARQKRSRHPYRPWLHPFQRANHGVATGWGKTSTAALASRQ